MSRRRTLSNVGELAEAPTSPAEVTTMTSPHRKRQKKSDAALAQTNVDHVARDFQNTNSTLNQFLGGGKTKRSWMTGNTGGVRSAPPAAAAAGEDGKSLSNSAKLPKSSKLSSGSRKNCSTSASASTSTVQAKLPENSFTRQQSNTPQSAVLLPTAHPVAHASAAPARATASTTTETQNHPSPCPSLAEVLATKPIEDTGHALPSPAPSHSPPMRERMLGQSDAESLPTPRQSISRPTPRNTEGQNTQTSSTMDSAGGNRLVPLSIDSGGDDPAQREQTGPGTMTAPPVPTINLISRPNSRSSSRRQSMDTSANSRSTSRQSPARPDQHVRSDSLQSSNISVSVPNDPIHGLFMQASGVTEYQNMLSPGLQQSFSNVQLNSPTVNTPTIRNFQNNQSPLPSPGPSPIQATFSNQNDASSSNLARLKDLQQKIEASADRPANAKRVRTMRVKLVLAAVQQKDILFQVLNQAYIARQHHTDSLDNQFGSKLSIAKGWETVDILLKDNKFLSDACLETYLQIPTQWNGTSLRTTYSSELQRVGQFVFGDYKKVQMLGQRALQTQQMVSVSEVERAVGFNSVVFIQLATAKINKDVTHQRNISAGNPSLNTPSPGPSMANYALYQQQQMVQQQQQQFQHEQNLQQQRAQSQSQLRVPINGRFVEMPTIPNYQQSQTGSNQPAQFQNLTVDDYAQWNAAQHQLRQQSFNTTSNTPPYIPSGNFLGQLPAASMHHLQQQRGTPQIQMQPGANPLLQQQQWANFNNGQRMPVQMAPTNNFLRSHQPGQIEYSTIPDTHGFGALAGVYGTQPRRHTAQIIPLPNNIHQSHLASPVMSPLLPPTAIDNPHHRLHLSIVDLPVRSLPLTGDHDKATFKVHIEAECFLSKLLYGPSGEILKRPLVIPGNLIYRLRCVELRPGEPTPSTDSQWILKETVWPKNLFIRVNDKLVELRRKAQWTKDLPADITNLISSPQNVLEAVQNSPPSTQTPEKRPSYHLIVEMFQCCDQDMLKNEMLKSDRNIPMEVAKQRIISRLTASIADDDEDLIIESTSLKITLKCPLSMGLLTIPVRGRSCEHLECFDYETYMSSRPRKHPREPPMGDSYRCPICKGDTRPRELIIDGFLVEVLKEARRMEERGKEGRDVVVEKDGRWEVMVEERTGASGDGDGGDGDTTDEEDLRETKGKRRRREVQKKERNNDETESEDEWHRRKRARTKSQGGGGRGGGGGVKRQVVGKKEIEVICLDDSD